MPSVSKTIDWEWFTTDIPNLCPDFSCVWEIKEIQRITSEVTRLLEFWFEREQKQYLEVMLIWLEPMLRSGIISREMQKNVLLKLLDKFSRLKQREIDDIEKNIAKAIEEKKKLSEFWKPTGKPN